MADEKGSIWQSRSKLFVSNLPSGLVAYVDPHRDEQLFYWQREKQPSDAEVDYVLSLDGKIIPVEVKAGSYGRLKSLQQFMQEKKSSIGVKISQDVLSFENRILSVPLYLIGKLPMLLRKYTAIA